jgi:putative ABC transport system permease protein
VLLIPAALGGLTRLAAAVLRPVLHFEGELARRQVLRRRARTTLTIGVLYIAVSSGIGLGTTIMNNVEDVRKWQAQSFTGDFYVRVTFADQVSGQAARMPESLGDEIRAIPGVIGVDTFRMVDESLNIEDQPASVIVRGFTGVGPLPLDLREGDPDAVRRGLFAGEVVAGSVLLQKLNKKVGDEVAVKTPAGPKRLRIAGMTTEYLAGGVVVHMEWTTAKRLLGVEGVGVFMVQARPEDLAAVEARLKAWTEKHGLMLHSFADLRRRLDGITNGVIASLWGLMALGFVVAAFGTANTLTMNVLEQTRELAMLRVVAMTRRQVRKTILSQATIIGAIGLVTGICGGVVGAYVTNLCAMAVLGHAVDFALHPEILAICFGAGLAIVLAAALIPAERAARLNLLIALQYE